MTKKERMAEREEHKPRTAKDGDPHQQNQLSSLQQLVVLAEIPKALHEFPDSNLQAKKDQD